MDAPYGGERATENSERVTNKTANTAGWSSIILRGQKSKANLSRFCRFKTEDESFKVQNPKFIQFSRTRNETT